MGKRCASREDVQELSKVVTKLASSMKEFAQWQAYHTIKDNPYIFNEKSRREILEQASGHITYNLYDQLFRAYPIKPTD